jgi:hypothetical protein
LAHANGVMVTGEAEGVSAFAMLAGITRPAAEDE